MNVRIIADGEPWVGMLDLTVRRSMDGAYHDFDFSTTDRYQEGVGRWNVRGGSAIQIFIGRVMIFDGFVNQYDPGFSPGSHNIQVTGESAAADLVNFGHEGPYFWKNVPGEQVISDVLTPYGIPYDITKPLKAIGPEGFRVAVDDRAFNIVQKIAQNNGLTTFTGNDFRLKISDGTNAPRRASLTTGDYPTFKSSHTISSAPSKLIVKSQANIKFVDKGGEEFSGTQRYQKILENAAQPRYRPLVIIHNGTPANVDDFTQYAQQRFTGDSVNAFCAVKDILDPNGDLWGIEQLMHLREPAGDIDETFIISDWELNVSEANGLVVGLTLREPRTYAKDVQSDTSLRRSLRRTDSVFGTIFRGLFNV